jgi:hypothetical protein
VEPLDEEFEACRRALALAAPSRSVSAVFTHGDGRRSSGNWPRLELAKTKTVKYAYLVPLNGQAELRLFPGDTLSQARLLYADGGRVENLLRLRERGWELNAGMHFGFATKGMAWMTASPDVAQYARYWTGAITRTRALERSEWPMFIRDMLRLGFANERDAERFEKAFTETERQSATPRPGLQVMKLLDSALDDRDRLAAEASGALREALTALREPAILN